MGGDWIIQERIYNCSQLANLLPSNAPLSTFRVVTIANPTTSCDKRYVPLVFVWRAGRSGEKVDNTPQSSVLFTVDCKSLCITHGVIPATCYQVGKLGAPALVSMLHVTDHPDTKNTLQGTPLPCAHSAIPMCLEAHRQLTPNVPLVGWDVAVAEDHGTVLLEANLSPNFFGGEYDRQQYLRLIDAYFRNCHIASGL